jgi:NAD(P)-dependent dehydrogenase (short-subunit alcohol dehydrogenase family)
VGESALADMRELFELNYWSAVHVVRALLPDLKASAHGRIVLFGSVAAVQGSAHAAAYAASKAALLRFAQVLAEELVDTRINVQVLLPGTIDTAQNRAAMPNAPHQQRVTPDQLADTVAFLLSPAASGIRFAALPMSGS